MQTTKMSPKPKTLKKKEKTTLEGEAILSAQQAPSSPPIRSLESKLVSDTDWLCGFGKLTQPL